MKHALLIFLLTSLISFGAPAPLQPGHIVVVYNTNSAESKELAEFYALNRKIPPNQIVGVPTTEKASIDRATYERTVRRPLVKRFQEAGWWTLGKDQSGATRPTQSRIRCLVLMKGMPLRITRSEPTAAEAKKGGQFVKLTEAAVDSELSLMGVSSYPISGPIPNQYFGKDLPFIQSKLPYMFLVARLDAHTLDHCKRMVLDAIDVEKDGLWGRTYVDHALKGGGFAIGDKWMSAIAKRSIEAGIPAVVDRQKNTFTSHYPMTDAAVYFGWYAFHRNGPFLNPAMKFNKGAVAIHLHSFSAEQLNNPARNWSAALIDRGAAATIGNTWEPYLQFTHDFSILYDRLLKGYTLIEASSMSMNALSWQNITIGDPLYRPFKNFEKVPDNFEVAREFKALRFAHRTWANDKDARYRNLTKAAKSMKSGTIHEFFGYRSMELENWDSAKKSFLKARELFQKGPDKLRQDLNLVELERRTKNIGGALKILRQIKPTYRKLAESKAIDGLKTILDPPAPPPTKK